MKHLFISIILMVSNCHPENPSQGDKKLKGIVQNEGDKIVSRFVPPPGYLRRDQDSTSFSQYLRNLKLLPIGSPVKYYSGKLKAGRVHAAVIDLHIGTKNLHQCADAIIRLRADYFYQNSRYQDISFLFTNGMRVSYDKWRRGHRIKVSGNHSYWTDKITENDSSYDTYWNYLETIFMYAGTLSLEQELKAKKLEKVSIGDVFIQGGSPGHALIVVDMVENSYGEKAFLLAQSYMPAQQLHVLTNPANQDDPWYYLKEIGDSIITPEWTFRKEDLMTWH